MSALALKADIDGRGWLLPTPW